MRLRTYAYRQRQKEKRSLEVPAQKPIAIVLEDPASKIRKRVKRAKSHANESNQDEDSASSPADTELVVQRQVPPSTLQIDPSSAYRGCFYATLLDRYLPAPAVTYDFDNLPDTYLSPKRGVLPTTNAAWILSACDYAIGQTNTVLSDAMLSMALCLVGAEQQNPGMTMSGLRAYQRALGSVSQGLSATALTRKGSNTFADLKQAFLGLACLACAITEIMANKSVSSFLKHLSGIGLLIQQSGPETIRRCPLMRDLYLEHRAIYLSYCFRDRKSAFYSEDRWMTYTDEEADQGRSSYLQRLADIAYPILNLIESYDAPGPMASVDALHETLRNVRLSHKKLGHWKDAMDAEFAKPIVTTKFVNEPDGFLAEQLDFVCIGALQTTLYYYGIYMQLDLMTLDALDDLSLCGEEVAESQGNIMSRTLHLARQCCRAMDYCFGKETGVLGKLIGLFPFDVAWQVFLRANVTAGFDVQPELRYIEKTLKRYEAIGIPPLKDRFTGAA